MKMLAAVPSHPPPLLTPLFCRHGHHAKNRHDGSGAISLKNGKSDQTKQVNRRRGCGGKSDGGGAGVAIIIFV